MSVNKEINANKDTPFHSTGRNILFTLVYFKENNDESPGSANFPWTAISPGHCPICIFSTSCRIARLHSPDLSVPPTCSSYSAVSCFLANYTRMTQFGKNHIANKNSFVCSQVDLQSYWLTLQSWISQKQDLLWLVPVLFRSLNWLIVQKRMKTQCAALFRST